MMKTIELRKYLSTKGQVGFWKWLPDGLENALEVEIGDLKIRTCIHLNYSGTSPIKILPDEIHRGNHWIDTFLTYITVPVDDDSDPSLYNTNPPLELQSKIASALREFESTFYGIIRNQIGQSNLANSHEMTLYLIARFLQTFM